jgi:hypothetical protein
MPCLLHWPRVHASTSLSSVVARPARPSPSASRSTLPTACPRVASAPRGASRRVGPPRPCSRRRSIEQHSVVPRVEGACSVAPRRSVRCQGRHADGRGPRRGSARRGARAEGAPSATPVRAAVSCARGLSWPAEAVARATRGRGDGPLCIRCVRRRGRCTSIGTMATRAVLRATRASRYAPGVADRAASGCHVLRDARVASSRRGPSVRVPDGGGGVRDGHDDEGPADARGFGTRPMGRAEAGGACAAARDVCDSGACVSRETCRAR